MLMLNEMLLHSWNVYAHLVLEVGLRDLDNSFHISYLYVQKIST